MSSVSGMSLRQRFVLLVCLAVAALGAAGLAIVELWSRSAAALESAAVERGEDAVDLMLQKDRRRAGDHARGPPGAATLRRRSRRALGDASAGYCTERRDRARGRRTAFPCVGGARARTAPPRRPAPARPTRDRGAAGDGTSKLLPMDREAVVDLCGGALRDRTIHARAPAPHDVLILSARAAGGGLVAWALVAVPPARSDDAGAGWVAKISVMGLATLLLVALAVEALTALRRGAADLEIGLLRLQDDLRAEIPARAPASSRASRSASDPGLPPRRRAGASARSSAASGTSSASRGSGAWWPAWLTRSATRSPGSS